MNDLISRGEALNTKYIVKSINGVDYVMLSEVQMKLRKQPSAQRDHIAEVSKKVDSDLISRQAAIRAYCEHECGKGMIRGECGCDDCGTIFDGIPSAQPELDKNTIPEQPKTDRLGVKTGETCTDTISREAAIKALKDVINDSVVLTTQGDVYSHDDNYFGLWVALSIIQKLQSAQPEIIRCKECKYYKIAWLKKDFTEDKRYKPSICVNGRYGITRKPDWFCADAERSTE